MPTSTINEKENEALNHKLKIYAFFRCRQRLGISQVILSLYMKHIYPNRTIRSFETRNNVPRFESLYRELYLLICAYSFYCPSSHDREGFYRTFAELLCNIYSQSNGYIRNVSHGLLTEQVLRSQDDQLCIAPK